MSLLDAIKKQTKKENIVKNHPVKDLDFEDKFNYVRGLALFVVIDDKISNEEKSLLNELIKTFNCGDFEDQLQEFLTTPDISELDNIIASINEHKVAHLFLLDALLISYADSIYDKNEKELLEVFKEKLDITNSEVELLEKFAKSISDKNYDNSVRAVNKVLASLTSKIDIKHLDCFLEEFDERKELKRILREVEIYFHSGEGGFCSGTLGIKLNDTSNTSFCRGRKSSTFHKVVSTTYLCILIKWQYDDSKEHGFTSVIQLFSPTKVLIQTRRVKYILKSGESGIKDRCPEYSHDLKPRVEFGFENCDAWELGKYKVKVFVEGKFYLEKEFEITK